MFAERLEIKAYNANTFMMNNEFVGFDNLSKFLIKRAKKVDSKVSNTRLDSFIQSYHNANSESDMEGWMEDCNNQRESDMIIILDERHTQKQISKLTSMTNYKKSLPLC